MGTGAFFFWLSVQLIHIFIPLIALILFCDQDLVFPVEPAAQINELAPLAAKRKELATGRGAIIRNRLFADRTFHNILPWVPVTF